MKKDTREVQWRNFHIKRSLFSKNYLECPLDMLWIFQITLLKDLLPSLSRGQIQVLLRELRKENRIHVIGTTSAARWFSDSIPTVND